MVLIKGRKEGRKEGCAIDSYTPVMDAFNYTGKVL